MLGQLKVTEGRDAGRSFDLAAGQSLVIGRGRDTATRLTDPSVSRVHCVLEVSRGRFRLTDSGSTSGTLVNDEPVTVRNLSAGRYDPPRRDDSCPARSRCPQRARARVERAVAHPGSAARIRPARSSRTMRSSLRSRGDEPAWSTRRTIVATARPLHSRCSAPSIGSGKQNFSGSRGPFRQSSGCSHENLVAVYAGAGKTNVICWIAMEYVDGESLTKVIRRIGPANMVDWRYALKVAVQVARALDAAHRNQIVHRNVTPANILIRHGDSLAKLNDLILAKATEGLLDRRVTTPGELIGDLQYTPPERTGDDAVSDPRSDIYSLGATLYALLTGRPPFEGHSLPETIAQIRTAAPIPPRKFQLAIPDLFQDVVLSMLAKRPDDRPASAADLLHALERTARYQGVDL